MGSNDFLRRLFKTESDILAAEPRVFLAVRSEDISSAKDQIGNFLPTVNCQIEWHIIACIQIGVTNGMLSENTLNFLHEVFTERKVANINLPDKPLSTTFAGGVVEALRGRGDYLKRCDQIIKASEKRYFEGYNPSIQSGFRFYNTVDETHSIKALFQNLMLNKQDYWIVVIEAG
jgi:hypothetical protein